MNREADIATITDTLGAPVSSVYDEVAGNGYHATLGDESGMRSVDVLFYPDTRIARIATSLADV